MIRALALSLVLTTTSAAAAEHAVIAPGSDFCLTRRYDAKHLKAHPRQLISEIRITGRNAWRGENMPSGLYATATIRFRDQKKPLALYGRCHDVEGAPALKCDFVPAAFQDVLGQTLRLEAVGDQVRAAASADWQVIRAGKEPDGPYGPPISDDVTFILDRAPHAACAQEKAMWTSKGPTPALVERLP